MSQSPITLHLHSGQNPATPLKLRARFGRARVPSMPPTIMILLAVVSVQLGQAVAKSLFANVGPSGVVLMRVGLAAIMLLVFWRKMLPNRAMLAHGKWKTYLPIVWLGMTIGVMNLSFYQALARLPLGVAVAIEFIGPLTLALFGSRRWLDAVWVVLAAAGIILLTPFDGKGLDIVGIGFALTAAACWAGYIVLGAKSGRILPGGAGLAVAMSVAAMIVLPFGIASSGTKILDPGVLLIGVLVALFATLIPFSLEFEALKRIPTRVFGVLMSMEPLVAVLVGFIVLGEKLNLPTIIAIACITIAATGATFFGKGQHPS